MKEDLVTTNIDCLNFVMGLSIDYSGFYTTSIIDSKVMIYQ